jgi:hypothetical protein
MTHDVISHITWRKSDGNVWKHEIFVQCRSCNKSAVWDGTPKAGQNIEQVLGTAKTANDSFARLILLRPKGTTVQAPEHTPAELKAIFDEAADCMTIGAWNAAGAMFRKVVDIISKEKMNAAPNPPTDKRTKFNLKPRLEWLFTNGHLPKAVEPLADAIREDGNDGVHNAPLTQADALDIQDFTVELLEAIYTLPGRLRDAEARRNARRAGA